MSEPIDKPSTRPEGVTTPTWCSPSLLLSLFGQAVAIWGVLEAAGAFALLPEGSGKYVAVFGAALRGIAEIMKRNGQVEAFDEVARGVKNNEAKVSAVAGAAAPSTASGAAVLAKVRDSPDETVGRGAVPFPPMQGR